MATGDGARSVLWQAPLVAVAAAAAYLATASGEFYKTDGTDIVRLLDDHLQGVPGALWPHPWHVGFLPALAWFRELLVALGLQPTFVQLGVWFSAIGAGVGVGFCHAAFRRLATIQVAWWATLLLALCPTVTLFATVVEFHGPLLAPVGMCVWWTARQIDRPSWWGMALLGVLCHAAFLMDGQAMFLPLWLLLFFLARRGARPARRDLGLAAVAGAVHLVLWLVMPRCLPGHYGFWADLSRGFAAEGSIGRPQSLDYLPAIVWQEWLRPLAPLSWLALGALAVRSLRRDAVVLVLGLLPFLYVSVRQLVFEPEFGAYLLPMLPAAALLVASLPIGRWGHLAVLLATVGNGLSLHPFGEADAVDGLPAAVAAAAGDAQPFLLVGSHRELTVVYERMGILARRRDPLREERFLWVRAQATLPVEKFTADQAIGVEQFLRLLIAQGRAVLITKTALSSLEDPRGAMLAEKATLEVLPNEAMAGPKFAAHLRARFDLQPGPDPMLYRLVPK
ncbi:MAG: hypothetical protein H6838_15010 [Planctomycetes bacterium]|nr:hypothetical protein [Planctomycetota bacterium]